MDENTKWYPLEAFCRKHGLIDPADMMFMQVRLGVWYYKHRDTRRYLHLLADGNVADRSEYHNPSEAISWVLARP